MKKLLRTRDILLLGLSGALDLFEEIRDPLSIFSKSYESMYGWVPDQYKKHDFNHLVWRNIKTGYIEKVEKNGEVYIRLTSAGNKKIVRDFPFLAFQNKKWDKKWRVVIFDIEEEDRQTRNRFRGKLKELGFGMLQESVFISPYDITQDFTEFIDAQHLSESAYLLEASSIAVGDIKALVNRVWNLDKINDTYRKIIEKIKDNHLIIESDRINKLNKDKGKKVKDGAIKDGVKDGIKGRVMEIKRAYLEAALRDPFLPRELLPSDWFGYEAKKLIKNL